MPRLRPLAPFVLPIVLVAASMGCERLAGIDGDFERQPTGPGGASPGVGGEGGGPGVQGSAGSVNGAGQAGASGGPPAMGSGGGGGPPGPAATVTAFVTGQENVADMTTDGNTLFWVVAGTKANGFNDGKVLSCSINGCNDTPTVIAENQAKPEYVGRADENVVKLPDSSFWASQIYWTTTLGGTVMRRPKNLSTPEVIVAQGQGAPAGLSISASAVSPASTPAGESYIYWAATSENKVKGCRLDPTEGCATGTTIDLTAAAVPPDTVAPGPTRLLTGMTYIYWITPGTVAAGQKDGHLYRYRKNPEPGPGRPSTEKRLFALANDLYRPLNVNLQGGKLYVIALGDPAAPPPAGTLWVAFPQGDDGSEAQVTSFASSPSFSDFTVTYKTAYWTSGGTLYGCALTGCPGTGPIEIARDVGTGVLTGEGGTAATTTDVLYAVKERSIIKIQVPVSIFAGP